MTITLEKKILSLKGPFRAMAVFECDDPQVVGDKLWQTTEMYVEQGEPFVIKNWQKQWDQSMFSFEKLQAHFGDVKHVCRRQFSLRNGQQDNEDASEEVTDEHLTIVEYIHRIAPHLHTQGGAATQPRAKVDSEEILKTKIQKDKLLDLIDQKLPANFTGKERLQAKDLSCPETWSSYLMKSLLPPCLVYRGVNDLTGLYNEAAIETLMVYIGDNGTHIPLHIDHCGVVGQNIMVEADEGSSSMWFVVRSEDEAIAQQFWKELGHNLDLESHCAPVKELKKAPFPIYVFQQHVGDLIVIPSKCRHQVNNIGGTTIKVAWNRITPNCASIALNDILPRYQKTLNPEMYRIKAVVYGSVQELMTLLEKETMIVGMPPEIYVKWAMTLIMLLRRMIESDAINVVRLKSQRVIQEDVVFTKPKKLSFCVTAVCEFCHADIWNRHITCTTHHYDVCAKCYSEGRGCSHRGTAKVQVAEFITHDSLVKFYSTVVHVWNNSSFLSRVQGYSMIEDDLAA
ncbi:hypothetical protein BGZ83_003176, partial [Gryganskiella cystojenkinii]